MEKQEKKQAKVPHGDWRQNRGSQVEKIPAIRSPACAEPRISASLSRLLVQHLHRRQGRQDCLHR